jgi:hypothetical protein
MFFFNIIFLFFKKIGVTMFKKLILTAGVVLGLCSNSVFSNPPMIKLGQANGIEYILKPGEVCILQICVQALHNV